MKDDDDDEDFDGGVIISCRVNPEWRTLELPLYARELCQYDEWYLSKHKNARQWMWADELFYLIRFLWDRDMRQFEAIYADFLERGILIGLSARDRAESSRARAQAECPPA